MPTLKLQFSGSLLNRNPNAALADTKDAAEHIDAMRESAQKEKRSAS